MTKREAVIIKAAIDHLFVVSHERKFPVDPREVRKTTTQMVQALTKEEATSV